MPERSPDNERNKVAKPATQRSSAADADGHRLIPFDGRAWYNPWGQRVCGVHLKFDGGDVLCSSTGSCQYHPHSKPVDGVQETVDPALFGDVDVRKTGFWSSREHRLFLQGLQKFGRGKPKQMARQVRTRNGYQCRSHEYQWYKRQETAQKKGTGIHDLSYFVEDGAIFRYVFDRETELPVKKLLLSEPEINSPVLNHPNSQSHVISTVREVPDAPRRREPSVPRVAPVALGRRIDHFSPDTRPKSSAPPTVLGPHETNTARVVCPARAAPSCSSIVSTSTGRIPTVRKKDKAIEMVNLTGTTRKIITFPETATAQTRRFRDYPIFFPDPNPW